MKKEPQPPHDNALSEDVEKSIRAGLKNQIPQATSVEIPQNGGTAAEKITNANKSVEKEIAGAVSKLFVELEEGKATQQESLLQSIIGLMDTQIWFVSAIMVGVFVVATLVWMCTSDVAMLKELLNFLKYYVGAVLVELLGLLALIAKSVFSSNYNKIMEQIIEKSKQK